MHARLVRVCKMDLGWLLPCLNWFMTNNPNESTGIVFRHSGSEQDRPKELPFWALRHGCLFVFLLILRVIQNFCFKWHPFRCGWHWFIFRSLFFFFTWLSVCPVTQVIDSAILKTTFRSLTFSMHHWQRVFQAWVRELLSLGKSPWHRVVFIGVLCCMRSRQGSPKGVSWRQVTHLEVGVSVRP